MKNGVNLILGLVMMMLVAVGLRYAFHVVQKAVAGEGIRGMVAWGSDWNDAVAEATAKHKPLLVEFQREDSPNCKELAKNGWSRMEIADATFDYVPVMVDIDAHPELAKQFHIETVPSLAVIDAKTGAIIRDGRDESFSHDQLLAWLKPDSKPMRKIEIPRDFSDWQKNRFDGQGNSFNGQGDAYLH